MPKPPLIKFASPLFNREPVSKDKCSFWSGTGRLYCGKKVMVHGVQAIAQPVVYVILAICALIAAIFCSGNRLDLLEDCGRALCLTIISLGVGAGQVTKAFCGIFVPKAYLKEGMEKTKVAAEAAPEAPPSRYGSSHADAIQGFGYAVDEGQESLVKVLYRNRLSRDPRVGRIDNTQLEEAFAAADKTCSALFAQVQKSDTGPGLEVSALSINALLVIRRGAELIVTNYADTGSTWKRFDVRSGDQVIGITMGALLTGCSLQNAINDSNRNLSNLQDKLRAIVDPSQSDRIQVFSFTVS